MATERQDEHLRGVSLRAGRKVFGLATTEPAEGRRRSFASEAIRWGYVLRARARWADSGETRARHEQEAVRSLAGFGLGRDALQAIAQAGRVVVHMEYREESQGWAARIFPWEYVLAAATRAFRTDPAASFVVLRELAPAPRALPAEATQPLLLFVQSAPGRLGGVRDFDEELARIRRATGDIRIEVLRDPTLETLATKVDELRPGLVHLSGFDNVQGLRLLRERAGPQTLVDLPPGLLDEDGAAGSGWTLARVLRAERALQDGYLLASDAGRPCVVTAHELATALQFGDAPPALVGVNLANSAPRTAALLVGEGAARSAVGFLGDMDAALTSYFLELLYARLLRQQGDVGAAFAGAWADAGKEPGARRATGITLWSSWNLDARPAPAQQAMPPAPGDPAVRVTPVPELNYAVLHNSNQGLFTEFVIERNGAPEGSRLAVDVELQLGLEPARWRRIVTVGAADRRWNLRDEVHLPLTANLVRTTRETVVSTVTVELGQDGRTLSRDSHRVRLLPVDQWRDNARDGQWLPSFVLPRDPAVMQAVQEAQRYVRVLRDDPAAGFEGYQAVDTHPPTQAQLRQVDLQVQAIWATLVHDWQLGYLNPPPSYSAALDSQRLRTPSTVRRNRAGTCIDLALLLAACLELVDIYPVVFLLDDHAFPGYWRHHEFHARFLQASEAPARATVPASSAEVQAYPWQSVGKDAHRELQARIAAGELVPLETVGLAWNYGFQQAIDEGNARLAEADRFDSLLDIVRARQEGVTPLPIVE